MLSRTMPSMRIFFYLLAASNGYSQTFSEIYHEQKFEIYFAHQKIDIPDSYVIQKGVIGVVDNPFNLSALYFGYRYNTDSPFGLHINYTNLALGDYLAFEYQDNFLDNWAKATFIVDKSFSTGPFGELDCGVNVLSRKQLNISAGPNIADYFIAAEFFDYWGEHFSLGLFLNVDKIISRNLVLRFNSHYNISMFEQSGEGSLIIRKYTVEVVWLKGWFAGIDYRIINPPHGFGGSGRRTAFKIGYRFRFHKTSE